MNSRMRGQSGAIAIVERRRGRLWEHHIVLNWMSVAFVDDSFGDIPGLCP